MPAICLCVWVFTDSWWWPMAGLWGQADRQWKAGLLKGYPYGVQPYENHYGNFYYFKTLLLFIYYLL